MSLDGFKRNLKTEGNFGMIYYKDNVAIKVVNTNYDDFKKEYDCAKIAEKCGFGVTIHSDIICNPMNDNCEVHYGFIMDRYDCDLLEYYLTNNFKKEELKLCMALIDRMIDAHVYNIDIKLENFVCCYKNRSKLDIKMIDFGWSDFEKEDNFSDDEYKLLLKFLLHINAVHVFKLSNNFKKQIVKLFEDEQFRIKFVQSRLRMVFNHGLQHIKFKKIPKQHKYLCRYLTYLFEKMTLF